MTDYFCLVTIRWPAAKGTCEYTQTSVLTPSKGQTRNDLYQQLITLACNNASSKQQGKVTPGNIGIAFFYMETDKV